MTNTGRDFARAPQVLSTIMVSHEQAGPAAAPPGHARCFAAGSTPAGIYKQYNFTKRKLIITIRIAIKNRCHPWLYGIIAVLSPRAIDRRFYHVILSAIHVTTETGFFPFPYGAAERVSRGRNFRGASRFLNPRSLFTFSFHSRVTDFRATAERMFF